MGCFLSGWSSASYDRLKETLTVLPVSCIEDRDLFRRRLEETSLALCAPSTLSPFLRAFNLAALGSCVRSLLVSH